MFESNWEKLINVFVYVVFVNDSQIGPKPIDLSKHIA